MDGGGKSNRLQRGAAARGWNRNGAAGAGGGRREPHVAGACGRAAPLPGHAAGAGLFGDAAPAGEVAVRGGNERRSADWRGGCVAAGSRAPGVFGGWLARATGAERVGARP